MTLVSPEAQAFCTRKCTTAGNNLIKSWPVCSIETYMSFQDLEYLNERDMYCYFRYTKPRRIKGVINLTSSTNNIVDCCLTYDMKPKIKIATVVLWMFPLGCTLEI